MSADTWTASQEAFAEAARWFAETDAADGERWEDAGLGEWTVRHLVGHTSRAMLTVESYLDPGAGAADEQVESAVEYFRLSMTLADPAAIAQRGRAAAVSLGEDPVAAVAEIAERVVPLVSGRAADDAVTTPVGGMRLGDYLPTRTFELVVHTSDLATALGLVAEVPPTAAGEALHLLADLALASHQSAPLLLTATGRGPLPEGFTVL